MAEDPPKKVLIIDDEPDIVEMIQGLLTLNGYVPLATTQWTEAVDAAEHENPDLMLLDLNMPTIDGMSLLRFLREQNYTFPVVVVSGYIDDEIRTELSPLGVVDFVDKPFEIKNLSNIISRILTDASESNDVSVSPESAPAESTPPEPAPASESDAIDLHNPGVLTPRREHRRDRERVMVPPPRKSSFLRRGWAQYLLIALICIVMGLFLITAIERSKEAPVELYPVR